MTKLVKRVTSVFLAASMIVTTAFSSVPASAQNTCDKTAADVVLDMTVGWNLGNSLDATNGDGVNSETSWGNPKTTKAMIDAVKRAGFNTVRVPVSWGRHTSGNNHTIDSAWMARVKEVVGYCIDNDMYVILNTHHDINATSDAAYYPTYARLDASNDFLESIWTQIANEFKDYDYHLIFETLNEPRLVGHEYEWWWPNDSAIAEPIACINSMNQTCLDAIRATGGNNSTRCIMVPGYCASVYGATADGFRVPNDSADDRIIVSVHAYTPVSFTLDDNGTSVFSDSLKSEIDDIFNTIEWIDEPVIIGEMSASNRNNSSERVKWAEYYFGKVAETIDYGANVPCILWDNNVWINQEHAGESHGHLDRSTLTWNDEPFINAIMDTLGVSSLLIKPDVGYLQKTEVVNNCYSVRAVMLISEEEANRISKVSFHFSNGSKNVTIDSAKCYSKITACGETLDAPEGYVFVVHAIQNIPDGTTVTCTGIDKY
ncbi:MAG: glycoside hydrolase family 5 protein [Ruminococcus sp.]|nr:glycoside hydrolase family 5 protein [Ruminococcus sp.]